MKGILKELRETTHPDKLGILCATLIICLSLFATHSDNLLVFLFGISFLLFTFAMSLNAEQKTEKGPITYTGEDGKTLTKIETFTSFILHFKDYPKISIVLFCISGGIFLLFLIRIARIVFK